LNSTLAKPLAYFGILWVVFGSLFQISIRNYGLYLLIGIVLYTFLTDAVGMMLPSILSRGSLLRRIAFPPIVIPISASVTAAMTFGVNLLAIAVFVLFSDVSLALDWLLLPLLVLELFVFIVGVGLIVATLFVRFRDVGPLWELLAQMLLFASPVMYPITILPGWAQKIVVPNPLVQVMQDARDIVLGEPSSVSDVLGSPLLRVIPIAITIAALALGLWLYRREAPRFAEEA
jgi:ABC-2 type transport system permease protein